MNNFMYNVATNGIGGVNVGGVEHDVVPGRGQSMAFNDSKTYQYLTRSVEHIKIYIEMGYLIPINKVSSTHTKGKHQRLGYKLSPEGRDKFNGSEVVDTWLIEWVKEKEVLKEERRLKRELKLQ